MSPKFPKNSILLRIPENFSKADFTFIKDTPSSIAKTRPLLENSTDRRKTITELVDARDAYYLEVASLVVDTTGKKLHEVINIIKRENENVE